MALRRFFARLTRTSLLLAALLPSCLWLAIAPTLAAPLPGLTTPSRDALEGLEAAPDFPATSGYVLAGQFSNREAAAAAAAQFERGGTSTFTDVRRQPAELTIVYFGPFERAEQANRAMQQLREHQVKAFVFETPLQHSFVVHAGAFSTPASAEKQAQELKSLGLSGVKSGRKAVSADTFRVWVDITEKPAPLPAPAPRIAVPAVPPAAMPAPVAPPAPVVPEPPLTEALPLPIPAPVPPPAAAFAELNEEPPLLTGRTRASWRAESRHWRQHSEPAAAFALSGAYSLSAATPDGAFALAAGIRGDYWTQAAVQDGSTLSVDYLPSFVAYREGANTWSLGFQRIDWNRAPDDSALDGLATRDLNHFILDTDIERRRRANAAVYWQRSERSTTLEAVWLPFFRPAELPDTASIWHPVNRERGRIRGLEDNAVLREFARNGAVSAEAPGVGGNGGGGVRMTHTKGRRYQAFAAQYLRRSEAYFSLSQSALALVQSGATPAQALAATSGPTLDITHPTTWLLGMEEGSDTWHFEVAWSSASPVTLNDLSTSTAQRATWQASLKIAPNQPRLEHWITLSGSHLLTSDTVLDRAHTLRLAGNARALSTDRDWRWGTRYLVGLDHAELHLNPYIMYVGFNNTDVTFGAHVFGGARLTEFGYHGDHNHIELGWASRY